MAKFEAVLTHYGRNRDTQSHMKTSSKIKILSMSILAPLTSLSAAADLVEQPMPVMTNSVATPELSPPKSTLWRDGVGSGFLGSASDVTIEAGVAAGMARLGSHQAHDLALLRRG